MRNLSIIIVNYKSTGLVLELLNTLCTGPENQSAEVIVVENSPCAESAARIRSAFPAAHVIANPSNAGFSRAVNQAIRKSTREFLLLVNPDARITPGEVSKLLHFASGHPDCGAVSPVVLYPDGSRQDFCSHFPTLPRQFLQLTGLRRLLGSRFRERFSMDLNRESAEVDWVIGACVLVRKKAVEDTGFLDEDFFMYGEDLDFCYRMAGKGWKTCIVTGATAYHEGSRNDCLRNGEPREKVIQRATRLFFRKHHGMFPAFCLRLIQFLVSFMRLFAWCAVFVASPGRRTAAKSKIRIHADCLRP